MTQRKLPQAGSGPPEQKTNADISHEASGKGSADYSLRIAFGELQHHLRQSRIEIDRLNRQRAKLAAEVEAKSISLGYLQQELEKGEREKHELHVKLLEVAQENKDLQKRLSVNFENDDATPAYITYPWSELHHLPMAPVAFKHQVDLGGGDAGMTESWEGVSRSLVSKMWKEMNELQELGKKFALDSCVLDKGMAAAVPSSSRVDPDTKDGVEEEDEEAALSMVSILSSQLQAAREKLMEQKKMLLALSKCTDSAVQMQGADKGTILAAKDDAARGHRATKESFKAQRTNEQHRQKTSTKASRSGATTAKVRPSTSSPRERAGRICPVCESSFPIEFPQENFEDHVMQHMTP